MERTREALPLLAMVAMVAMASAFAADDHDRHRGHLASAPAHYSRSQAEVVLPAVTLQAADGRRVKLAAELDDGRPVVLNFIFTTCTAICPPMSQVFSAFQKKLGAEADSVRLVSVSIDPEVDTPERLRAYAQRFEAGPQWSFLTGSVEASTVVQKAFGAWRSDKMSHTPTTWLRAAPGKPWLRLDGFTTPDELAKEYRQLVAAR